jgi:hypothetical protein
VETGMIKQANLCQVGLKAREKYPGLTMFLDQAKNSVELN